MSSVELRSREMGRHSSTSSCASALANGPGPPTLPSPGPPSYPSPYDGLPAKFVQSMKTLFDILDEKGSGLVPLRDIESRWAKQANAQVLDNLRSIAAQNQGQLLSFDRFCLALKMALLAESPKSSCNNSVSSVTSGGSAPSNGQNAVTSKSTPSDNLNFNHRRQGSSSSAAGSLDTPRFTPMFPASNIVYNGGGGSRLPKFGNGGGPAATAGGNSTQAQVSQAKTSDSGSAPTRAASVPLNASDPFSHQGDMNANGTAAPGPKLNASFENLLETPTQSKLPPRKPFSSSTTHQTQQAQQQAGHQRHTILPPSSSMVRPPSNMKVLSRLSSASGVPASTASYVGNRIPPPGRPGPPTQSNTRRIVRPPGAPLEPMKFQMTPGPAAPEGAGRSRTPDNFLENSGGQLQRAIKPPMTRSVSNIAESMPHNKSMNEPANRSPFTLGSMPGANQIPPPPAKSSFTPVAPPAARRAYSVMHEIHNQSQHHQQNHHHPASHPSHQDQYLPQFSQSKWEPGPQSQNAPSAMMAPIQTEQVHTANKVSLGSAIHRGAPVNKTQIGQLPRFIPQPSVTNFNHPPQQAPITTNPPISQSNSNQTMTTPPTNPVLATPNSPAQNGFNRNANSRDLNAMVRAVPCQASIANVQQTQQVPMRQMAAQLQTPGGPKPEKPPRRREPRRHTLAHGIEYGTIRRLKLLEQERDVLQKGLQAVERAKDWYLRQISFLQEKLQAPAQAHGAPEYSTDAHEERLRFQMARILDVNQHLSALVDSGDKPSFPLHMNLALLNVNVNQNSLQNQNQSQEALNEAKRLREHNVKLASDLDKKQELIAQLEAEKTQLVRELFASKAQQQQLGQAQRFRSSGQTSADTTLM